MRDFSVIVNDAAVKAVREARQLALEGNFEEMRLYYRKEELRLTALLVPDNVGWKDTGRVLKSNVPYDRYNSWIRKNSTDLPLYAEVQS